MANISAHLIAEGGWHWRGFYIVNKKSDQLFLGPFEGPVECTSRYNGNGGYSKSWVTNSTVIVPNLHELVGHVACSLFSNYEVVIPLRHNGNAIAVLDIDFIDVDGFNQEEVKMLEPVVSKLKKRWVG